MPLIMYLKVIEPQEVILPFYPLHDGVIIDLVSYYKNIYFLVVTALLVIYFIKELLRKNINIKFTQHKVYLTFSFLFTGFIIVSYFVSDYKDISLLGAPNSLEGTLTWISYLVVFSMSLFLFENEYYQKFINFAVIFIINAFAVLGITILVWKNPLETKFVQYLMLPLEYINQAGTLKMSEYFDRISLTLFNPNYLGHFLALVLPLYFIEMYKRLENKLILYFVFTLPILIVFMISGASTAIYIFLFTLIILAIYLRKHRILKYMLSIVVSFIGLFVLTPVFQKIPFINTDIADMLESESHKQEYIELKDLKLNKDNIEVISDEYTFKIYLDDTNQLVVTSDNKDLEISNQQDKQLIKYKTYEPIKIEDSNDIVLVTFKRDVSLLFTKEDSQFYHIGANGYLVDSISQVNRLGVPKKYLGFATGRGYIWDISIPLLKDNIILGNGADTSVFYIPQYELVGKINHLSNYKVILDKPHNMYLQIGLNFGVLALLLFIIVVLYSYYQLLKNRKNERISNLSKIFLIAGISNFLMISMFYDSNISVTPIFILIWAYLMNLNSNTA